MSLSRIEIVPLLAVDEIPSRHSHYHSHYHSNHRYHPSLICRFRAFCSNVLILYVAADFIAVEDDTLLESNHQWKWKYPLSEGLAEESIFALNGELRTFSGVMSKRRELPNTR
jgi:hypothetical protein